MVSRSLRCRRPAGSALARRGRHLGGEIAFLLLDALAEREADEAGHLDGAAGLALGLLERLRDRLGRVVHVGLLEQADLLVEGLQAGIDDLLDDVLGFPLLPEFVGQHGLLALDRLRIETRRVDRLRVCGGDVHRDHPAHRDQLVGLARRFERDDDADLAEALGHRIVHVHADGALADLESGGAAQGHVLADLGDGVADGIGDRDRADLGRLDLLHVGAGERDVRDHGDEPLEQVVARDEVGLGIDLDHDALRARDLDADQALGSDAPGLLGGLGQALLAQPVLRRGQVALGLGQRRLAIHHAGAGRLAQLLDHLGGDICHLTIPRMESWPRPSVPASRAARIGGALRDSARPAKTRAPRRRGYSTSAVSSLALAIQPAMRPGRPTSSPTLCAAFSLSPAICEKWKMPRSLSCFSTAPETPGSFLRSSAWPRGPGSCSKPRSADGCVGMTSATVGFSWAPRSMPASPCAREMPSMAARAIRSQYSDTARLASSLPGTTKLMPAGSQLVSTMAATGMLSRRASLIAMSSLLVSITNSKSGTPPMSLMPPSARSSLSRSRCIVRRSFLV